LPKDKAEVVVGNGVFRVELDGLVVTGDGLVELLLTTEGVAEVVVHNAVFGIGVECDGLAEVGDGIFHLALA
jgi:hypothetical protein